MRKSQVALPKQNSNVGSGLFNHIFIDVSLWGASGRGGVGDVYTCSFTQKWFLGRMAGKEGGTENVYSQNKYDGIFN